MNFNRIGSLGIGTLYLEARYMDGLTNGQHTTCRLRLAFGGKKRVSSHGRPKFHFAPIT